MRNNINPFSDLENKKICYDYLYLDDCQALNALSAAAGGIEGDSTIEVTKNRGGSAELKYSIWGAELSLGGRGSRAQRQQFINRQTIHSQMSNLFKRTVTSVAEVKDDVQVPWLKEGYLVKFDSFILPLSEEAPKGEGTKSLWSRDFWVQFLANLRLGWSSLETRERTRRRSLIGHQKFISLARVVDTSGNLGGRYIALQLTADYVMVSEKQEFSRRATVFGWVEGVPRENLYSLAIVTNPEKPGVDVRWPAEGGPAELTAADGRDQQKNAQHAASTLTVSQSGISAFVAFPPLESVEIAAWVRPICIYR